MGFIADSIRIAKDGSVTTVSDPTQSQPAAPVKWTAKKVCEHIAQSASYGVGTAKPLLIELMTDHNFQSSHITLLADWMDTSWKTLTLEKRTWAVLDFFHKRCP